MPAMALEMVVGPARAAADRGTPERLAEDAADDAANQRARRTGDDETCSGAGRRADHVRAGAQRESRNGGKDGDGQNRITHGCPPLVRHDVVFGPRRTSRTTLPQ